MAAPKHLKLKLGEEELNGMPIDAKERWSVPHVERSFAGAEAVVVACLPHTCDMHRCGCKFRHMHSTLV